MEKPKRIRIYHYDFDCDLCSKKFTSAWKRDLHRRMHTGEKPFKCTFCPFAASQARNLKTHIRVHIREKPFICQEPGCSYAATQLSHLKTHKLTHTPKTRFQCPLCPYKSSYSANLRAHMLVHNDAPPRPHPCPFCPYRFKRKQYVKFHIATVHSEGRNFKCPHEGCNFSTTSQIPLNSHLESLRHVFESQSEGNFICPYKTKSPSCGYRTHRKVLLQTHIRSRHAQTENFQFKCFFCDRKFPQNSLLQFHLRGHTKEKPYKCEYPQCDYEARLNSYLTKHVRKKHEKQEEEEQQSENDAKAKPSSRESKTTSTKLFQLQVNKKCTVSKCPFQTRDLKLMAGHLNQAHRMPKVLLHSIFKRKN